MLPAKQFEFALRGPAGNTSGGALVAATSCSVADILDTCLGTAVEPAGAATTVSGGSGAGATLTVASGAGIPNGMAVGFFTNESPLPIFRRVISGGGTGSLTFDRTYTGTPTVGGALYRSLNWAPDPAVHELTHLFARGEADNRLRNFYGGMGTVSLDFAVGQYARLVADMQFTDVDDSAEINPTFTEPTDGNAIVTLANRFYVGGDAFMAVDLACSFGGTVARRVANSGPNGFQGFTVARGGDNPLPKITGKLYAGTNTTLGEVADSVNTFRANYAQGWDRSPGQESVVWNVAFQAGNVFSGGAYVHAPAGVFTKFEETVIEGKDGYDFELDCYYPTAGAVQNAIALALL
jgi:hypothetical protein